MTDPETDSVTDPETSSETGSVVFPLLGGLNWPSYLLQAWRTLHGLGVPEENLRLLAEVGHFAAPEVGAQEPPGPAYDPLTGRLTVTRVDPRALRPRLAVSVREDVVEHFWEGEDGREHRATRRLGRLAHFVAPLTAGLPGVPRPPESHSALEDLTRQVCGRYPELMAALGPEERGLLGAGADDALAILAAPDSPRRAALIGQAARRADDPALREACRRAWPRMAAKLPPRGIPGLDESARAAAGEALDRWADLLYGPDPDGAAGDGPWDGLTPTEADGQRALLRALLSALSYETPRERERVVREMVEIISTEALLATAVLDSLAGIGWVHGRVSDQRVSGTGRHDGWLLSVTGGRNSRALMQSRLEGWAAAGGVLGVRAGEKGSEEKESEEKESEEFDSGALDLTGLDETGRTQLWALASWRRDAADPFVLLETAARRLIHPDVAVRPLRYAPVISRPGTLTAQLDSTATLGGAALLLYPGVSVEVPLSDADEGAEAARATLAALLRLFLPVCCAAQVVWRESEARLDRPSYLVHDFQAGARLSDAAPAPAGGELAGDPLTL